MTARFIAILLSFFIIALPLHAENFSNSKAKQPTQSEAKINLNKADANTLTGSFKGIGKKRAEAIVAYRQNHQGFKTVEELGEVKGIGQRFVKANRDKLNQVFVVN